MCLVLTVCPGQREVEIMPVVRRLGFPCNRHNYNCAGDVEHCCASLLISRLRVSNFYDQPLMQFDVALPEVPSLPSTFRFDIFPSSALLCALSTSSTTLIQQLKGDCKSLKMTSIFSRNSKVQLKKVSDAIKALIKRNKSGTTSS